MPVDEHKQELHLDLDECAEEFRWAANKLLWIAERLNAAGSEEDAQAVMRIIVACEAGEERLKGFASDAKAGRIVRVKVGKVGRRGYVTDGASFQKGRLGRFF